MIMGCKSQVLNSKIIKVNAGIVVVWCNRITT